jgi:hypothetical protein
MDPLCRTPGAGLSQFGEFSFLCSAVPYFGWNAPVISAIPPKKTVNPRGRRPRIQASWAAHFALGHRRYPAEVTATGGTGVEARQRRAMAGLLLAAALLIAAYWLAWLLHRSLVASETGAAYTQFEDAFPLADAWLALCLVAASFCLWTARRAALFWLLAGGGAGLYLFAMDVLYDLQHGVWGKGANGVTELVINVVTLALSLFVLRWTWVRRDALLA